MGWLELYLIDVCKILPRQECKVWHLNYAQIKIDYIAPELIPVCGNEMNLDADLHNMTRAGKNASRVLVL